MTDNLEHAGRIEQINLLLINPGIAVPEVNDGIAQEIDALKSTGELLAKPEFEHKGVGYGYSWLPKHMPDFIRCFPEVNPLLAGEIGVHTPFRKEGPPAVVTGISIVEAAGIWCARYDLVPEGSGLVVSVLYRRERVFRAGKSVLELSAR